MAAISSLLQVLAAWGLSRIRMLPDGYKETIELMQLYGPTLHLVEAMGDTADVLWLSSACCGSDLGLETTCRAEFALIVCDTPCSAPQSGRIRRVLASARRTRTPLVLVRSHIKLDSLGVEFGRLGSALFLAFPEVPLAKVRGLRQLARDLREVIRLMGTAATPGNFCPFFGSAEYWSVSASRCAAILANTRALRTVLAANFGRTSVRGYPHEMFAALTPPRDLGHLELAGVADEIAQKLAGRGLPVRHAGSFGFDFVAIDVSFDTRLDRLVLRIAPADLPMSLTLKVADGIASCWRSQFQTGQPERRQPSPAHSSSPHWSYRRHNAGCESGR